MAYLQDQPLKYGLVLAGIVRDFLQLGPGIIKALFEQFLAQR